MRELQLLRLDHGHPNQVLQPQPELGQVESSAPCSQLITKFYRRVYHMSAVFDQDIQREIRSGNRQILAKAITNLENSNSDIQIPKVENPIQVLGITGAPGVGKSTTVDAIVKYLRKKDLSVAVLAVDPSSPISGGALLGDRIRLSDHFTDPKVFIRSIATRGHLGGLSSTINQVLNLIPVPYPHLTLPPNREV